MHLRTSSEYRSQGPKGPGRAPSKHSFPHNLHRPRQAKLNCGDSVVSFSRGKRKKKKKESFAKLVSERLTHIVHLSKAPKTPPTPPKKGKLQKLCELWGDKVGGPVSGLLPTFAGTVNTIKIKGLQSDQSSSIGMSSSLQAQNKSLIQHSKGFCLPNVRNKHKTFYHVTFMTLEESSHPALRLLSATDKSHQ